MTHARIALAGLTGLAVCASAAWLLSTAPSVEAAPKGWRLPANAKKVGPNVYDLGTRTVRGKVLRGYAILDQGRTGKARPEGKGKPDKGGGGGDSETSNCYAYIVKGAKWRAVEGYWVDASNANLDASLTPQAATDIIVGAVDQWEDAADGTINGSGVEIFGGLLGTTVDASSIGNTTNDKNEVAFGAIAEPGTIAVTFVWGVFGGKPANREIVEWDQLYDDVDWTFGVVPDGVDDSPLMDFESIATHKMGHAFGMGHPDGSCALETMYATASEGETIKRDLHTGDITGIDRLYD